MEKRKLILVSNDDGIDAKGLYSLIEIAKKFGNVFVVAPEDGQSGMSHSISLAKPLRVRYLKKSPELTICAVPGTPADCVKLAVNQLLPAKPDIMLSGINHGSNAAVSVVYSGTMGAAIEASLYGIPSIGFSLLDHSPEADFTIPEKFAAKVIENVLGEGLPYQVALNINYPKIDIADFKGYRICKQTPGLWSEKFDKRIDPYGREYYWLTGSFLNTEPDNEETDEWALKNNYASIVPVKIDFTHYSTITNLKNRNL